MKNTKKISEKKEKTKKSPQEIRKELGRWVVDILLIVVGGIIYSAGLHCFSAPNDIAPGGVAGISTLINAATGGMNIGILYGIINIPLIIIGFIFLGKKMMVKTLISVAVVTFATDYGLAWAPIYENGDKMLASVCAGVLFGIGLGVVYIRESTTGGTDIINKIINKKFPHISVGAAMLGTDAVIIGASMIVFKSFEAGLYALIAIFISSKVLDLILYGSFEGKMLLIFSDKYEEISEYVMTSLDRGLTWLDGTGAYSKQDKHVICCAVHKSEYAKIKRKVKEIDPKAFIIITDAGEVLGEGFQANQ
ncbi:MAG: YitT family protein [Firmicutes bacterium]|nr:YitT family protein [[Eubacterium] siraeum]MCM1487775.1 YitT family protein [Bacillota bacterium]